MRFGYTTLCILACAASSAYGCTSIDNGDLGSTDDELVSCPRLSLFPFEDRNDNLVYDEGDRDISADITSGAPIDRTKPAYHSVVFPKCGWKQDVGLAVHAQGNITVLGTITGTSDVELLTDTGTVSIQNFVTSNGKLLLGATGSGKVVVAEGKKIRGDAGIDIDASANEAEVRIETRAIVVSDGDIGLYAFHLNVLNRVHIESNDNQAGLYTWGTMTVGDDVSLIGRTGVELRGSDGHSRYENAPATLTDMIVGNNFTMTTTDGELWIDSEDGASQRSITIGNDALIQGHHIGMYISPQTNFEGSYHFTLGAGSIVRNNRGQHEDWYEDDINFYLNGSGVPANTKFTFDNVRFEGGFLDLYAPYISARNATVVLEPFQQAAAPCVLSINTYSGQGPGILPGEGQPRIEHQTTDLTGLQVLFNVPNKKGEATKKTMPAPTDFISKEVECGSINGDPLIL